MWPVASAVTSLTEIAAAFQPNRRRIADTDAVRWLRIVAAGPAELGEAEDGRRGWTAECSDEARLLLAVLDSDTTSVDRDSTVRLEDLSRDAVERSRKRSEAVIAAGIRSNECTSDDGQDRVPADS